MKRILGTYVAGRAAVGLLLLRLVLGLGIGLHGYQKYSSLPGPDSAGGPFGWAAGMPFHPPPFFQGLATLAEFGGGFALMVGLLTPLSAFGILMTMGTAIIKFHWARGAHYVSLTPGVPEYELAGHYFIFALALLVSGPGSISLDALIFGRRFRDPAYVP